MSLNPKALQRLREMESEGYFTVAEYVGLFAQESAARLQNLRDALSGGDAETVHREAHTLKSAAREVGADTMAALAEQIEMQGQRGQLGDGVEPVAQLGVAFAAALDELTRLGFLESARR